MLEDQLSEKFVDKLLSYFLKNGFQVTQKLKESLINTVSLINRGIAKNGIFDDSILLGLIESRSIIIPILDSLGISIEDLLNNLKESASITTDINPDDIAGIFFEELELLNSADRVHLSLFRVLTIAKEMAHWNKTKIIDTATYISALFKQSVYCKEKLPKEIVKEIAQRSLSDQILAVFSHPNVKHELSSWLGDTTSLWDVQLEDALELRSEFYKENIHSSYYDSMLDVLSAYINIRELKTIEDQLKYSNLIEPYIDNNKLILVAEKNKIIARECYYLNAYQVTDIVSSPKIKINMLTGKGFIKWEEIEEFEALINRNNTSEYDLQNFFEKHPRFLMGAEYQNLHSQLVLIDDSGRKLIPDFFAERIGTTFCDIIDLKTPNCRIISGKDKRRGISAAVNQGLNQLREYRNYFDNAKNRREFYKKYGLNAFRPTICVVIGRSYDYLDYMERLKIEDEYKNLKIATYDDILIKAKKLSLII